MNKSSVIGFALIGIILLGFSWYNSVQFDKRQKAAMEADSLARASQEIVKDFESVSDTVVMTGSQASERQEFSDSLVNLASAKTPEYYTISNDKLEVMFTTRGAQMHQVEIKPFVKYDSSALYMIRPEKSRYNVTFFTDRNIETESLVFDIAERTDTSVVMRLNFQNGGYVEQKYWLESGSFVVKNKLSFVNMEDNISRKMSAIDIDWSLDVPRIEKGYKNERQYSRVDYMFPNGDVEIIGKGKNVPEERIGTKLSWFAFQQHFFSAIMVAENSFSGGTLSVHFNEAEQASETLMNCTARMSADFDLSDRVEFPFDFYIGPNHYQTLKASGDGFEEIVSLGGWLASRINKWAIIPFFNWLHKYIANFGIIILLMTICIKLILSPLTIKSYMSSAKMGVIKPEIDKLNEKYPKPEDAMKKQQAMMDLYRKAGISPMGGCLPMLLQLPILYAMFRFFPTSFELRQQSFLWADDLSAYDSILDFGFNIPLLGDHLSLFSLLMAVSMFVYSKLNSAQMGSDPNMAPMRFMTLWLMPIMMFILCNNFSSGLSYYYMLSNLFTIAQTWFIKKYVIDENKIMAQIHARSMEPPKKSKFMERLEAAQKAQQQAMREQAKEQAKRNRR